MDIVTLAAAKKYTDDKLKSSGNGGAVTDNTLTVSGAAADAKVTGDRLNAIEYQTVTTDIAYTHEELPEIEKSVIFESDGIFGDKAYISYGTDLLPRGGFNQPFPWGGITITTIGDTYKITGQMTGNFGIIFLDSNRNRYVELPNGLVGKTLRLLGFTDLLMDKMVVNLYFYDANKTQLLKKPYYLAKTTTTLDASVVVPEGTVYYSVELYSAKIDTELNHQTKLYLFVTDELEEVSLAEGISNTSVTSSDFATFPYKSSVQYKVSLNEYISNFAGGGTVTYLTPEDFGAAGDGSTDDSEAISLCFDKAVITKQTVLMAKKYYVTQPIDIKHNGLNIIANDIVYDGTDTAIKISGQNNSIKIHSIISRGVGITYRADNNMIVKHNDIDVNAINSASHGIVFYNGLMGIYQNTVKFNSIKAGGSGTYGLCEFDAEGSSWVTENNFYGGQISNCEWAVYRIKGNSKCYGIQIEENVQGGFYIAGIITIFHPRLTEAMRDGNLPAYKFVGYTNRVTVYDGNGININQIDLSEADETFVADSGEVLFAEEHHISVINSPIYSTNIRDGMDNTSGNLYTNKVYIWGKYLIMTPHMAFSKTVDSEIFDTRLIGTETEAGDVKKLPQLPTKFIVNTLDTEIYLHPSYCPFGFNEFEVEQSNNCTCKIYDVKGYLIFDGTDKGDGTYILKVYKDEKDKPGIYFGALEYSYFGCLWQVTEVNRDLQSRERLDNLEYNFITTESAYEHNELSESSKDLIIEAEPTWGGDVFINYGTDLIPRESFNRTFPWGGVTITHEDYTFKLTGVVTSKTTVNLTKADDRSNIYHELPEGSVGKVLNLMMFTEDASNIAINFDIYDADKNNILHAVPGALIDRIYTSKKYTIPEGAVYYSIGFYFVNTDVELDTDIKLYLLIDNEYERLTLSNGKAMRKNILATSLSTLPYKSYLRYKGGIKELALIDNIPTKTSELENDSGYVTSNDLRNLPEVTEADNGKVLMVVNGTWQVVNTEGLTAITKNEEEIPLSETY